MMVESDPLNWLPFRRILSLKEAREICGFLEGCYT